MRRIILDAVSDLVSNFVYYDRKGDDELSGDQLQNAIKQGDITIDEIVKEFRQCLENSINADAR